MGVTPTNSLAQRIAMPVIALTYARPIIGGVMLINLALVVAT